MSLKISLLNIIFACLIVLAGCGNSETISERPDLEKHFKKNGFTGAFALKDMQSGQKVFFNPKRCKLRFPPAATFKIFIALAGLEAGIIKDKDHLIRWDGTRRKIPSWNQDQTLKSAMENSVDWYFEEVVIQIGLTEMQSLIKKAKYGNQKVTGGIDEFWLKGDLKISPDEQLDFLEKFYTGKLPFAKKNIEIVKEILLKESTESHKFYGKTGVAESFNAGWYIGFIEKDDEVYLFANLIFGKLKQKRFNFARIRITQEILSDLDVLE